MRTDVGRGIRYLAATLVVALLGATAAVAQDQPPTETPPEEAQEDAPFRDGPWIGSMAASGEAEATVDAVHSRLTTHHSGTVSFDIDNGQAQGEGEMLGSSLITYTGAIEGFITMEHVTPGEIGGDESGLVFDGVHTTEGTAVTLSPVSGSHPVGPNQAPFGPFDVELVEFDCNRIFGDWSTGFERAAIEGGWQQADIEGQFQADHLIIDLGVTLREEAEQLLDDFNDWVDAVHDNVHADAEEASTVFDTALQNQLYQLVNRAVDLEFELRNAPDAELCAFGTLQGGFSYVFTAMVQELAVYILSSHAGLTGETLRILAENLSWMGGIGPGAIRTETAQHIETLMEQRGSEILEGHLVTDPSQQSRAGEPCSDTQPCLDPTNEALEVLNTGAKHELTFSPNDIDIPPQQAGDMVAAA